MIHGHGNDPFNYPYPIRADFSSNVVYQGVPEVLIRHLSAQLYKISVYPDPEARELRARLATHHNIDVSQIVVTNGSTEAFYLLAQLFRKSQSLIISPAFAEYQDAALIHEHSLTYLANSQLNETTQLTADIVWLGNPNNPDGKTFEPEFIKQICYRHPSTHFIVDEAYHLLCDHFTSLCTDKNRPENLIIVRSLTKAFAIPGIRIGYLIATEAICNRLNRIKMPWNVNTLAIEAGQFILDHFSKLIPNTTELIQQSCQFQKELGSINGLLVIPSNCNYFLVKLKKGNAAELKNYLLKQHGILIRDASNFNGLNHSCFRVAVQTPINNQNLIKAINQWIHLQL